MTKSDPYTELFHAMAKVPVIPAGLTQIGSDVGRVVDRAPAEQPHAMSCGDVGNVMPEVAQPHYMGIVAKRYGACYCAKAVNLASHYVIIVPDGTEDTGSRILTIARSEEQAWKQAAELCER